MEREGVGKVNGEVDGGGGRKRSEVNREGGREGGREGEGGGREGEGGGREGEGGGRSVFGTHHSFAVFADGCTNESVLNKIVCESFSEKRVSTQKVGQHLIIADHAITEEGGRERRVKHALVM